MASFNVSVPNSSPLIYYTAAWLDTPVGDAYAANYTGRDFHATSISGATATFKFNGTGVWFYGALRPGYGNYSLSVDGNTVFNGSAAASSAVFDQFLGGSSQLGMGEHTAVLTNTGGGCVDLDSLVFETHVGAEDQQVASQTVDDTNPAITYLPSPSEWSVASNPFFSNGSVHFTNLDGADVALSFSGDAIALYGGVSFDHGDYTVTLDGQKQTLNGANGQARIYHSKSLLFFSTGFGSGTHSLGVSTGNGFFDLDAVVIYQATGGKSGSYSTGGTAMANPDDLHVDVSDSNNVSPRGAAAHNQPMSKTGIAGIVTASLLGFISILALLIFLVSRYRKRRAMKEQRDGQSPVLPIQEPDLEAGINAYDEKKPDNNLKRSTSQSTAKSFASRWSQLSFAAGAPPAEDRVSEIPPVPAMRIGLPANPKLNMSAPQHKRSESSLSDGTILHSPDGDSVLDDYYYRHSTGSQNSVAPLRPARPPGLNLEDLGPGFDHVPL
ncbi:uncharacterized protein PHACADRAFT_210048 [Phanerochaete carnosa HHB-10118-sp]|uniref:Uncharacterized protein n=1 Tax=Phanerochaete carnosa (strain HHB-10118-sp) TaxID=650164 RepID=K5WUT9_PHACS|nr:uncharacterized protein PHACADRAFT_210048 [Phanerochaete carnosa HHB-10118-sp]EKM54232.1 hypothetical protein PHACADRAFT_210048 [Phanerochaete carnosa HHB-10118-sp]